MLFKDKIVPVISESINREYIQTEQARQAYATELLDTYQGFGKKYIEELISTSIKSEMIKKTMLQLICCYPLLQNFMDEISMVYKVQPTRQFYLGDKLIVKESPTGDETYDKEKYLVDADLFDKLNGFYNREFCLRIKEAETKTNLLSTTIFKVNNREGEIKLDFIPNDAVTVLENRDDLTQMDALTYIRGVSINQNGYKIEQDLETWDLENFTIESKGKKTTAPNRAAKEYKQLTKKEHIGSGFPPFVVLRNSIADQDFWNTHDKDTVDLIKQLNVAFTELRYLQRFGSFGLKYVVNASVPKGASADPMGFWEFEANSRFGDDGNSVSVGELKNDARITELISSIFEMLKFLYDLFGVNAGRLVSTKNVQSAESKVVDKQSMKEYLVKQQEIWSINEENIFKTIITVYNRDNTEKLPDDLSIGLDFYDEEETPEFMEAKINNWLLKINSNIASYVDWIRSENPDLSEEEAKAQIQKNRDINDLKEDEESEGMDDESDGNSLEDGEEEEQVIDETDKTDEGK